jgi:hypothetical protein
LAFLFSKCPHHKFYFLKKIQKKKEKKIDGVAEPPLGQTGWPATPAIFFSFFFWIFFKKIKFMMRAF